MGKLIDFLFISLMIVFAIILYRLLLKKLSKGKVDLDSFCTLYSLEKNLTIIIVAHRLNTLSKCDVIFEVKNKKIIKL